MTSELRPAVEVLFEAAALWEESLSPEDGAKAVAAVIEADREVVRAPLLAENERLTARVAELEALLREIRTCTSEHGGAAKALKLIGAALETKHD